MEVLQRGKTRPDSYSGEEKRLDEGMWFMGSSRILEKSRLHLFFFFFFNSRDWKGKQLDFWGDLWDWKERCGCRPGRNGHLYQSGHGACGAVGTLEGTGWVCARQVWAAWVECGTTGKGAVLLAVSPSFQEPCQPMILFSSFGVKVRWPSSLG